ncbi:MAG: DUF6210 family protein [Planctomycetales bacterium]
MKYVFVNLSGKRLDAIYLLIADETGVTYGHQSGEGANFNELEGYMIPLAERIHASDLELFFTKIVLNTDISNVDNVNQLETLVSEFDIMIVDQTFMATSYAPLELDLERIKDAVDGWIPVKSVYGPGVLIY